jgi:hypothetical protein
MAALVVVALVTIATGIFFGGFLLVSLAIRRDDKSQAGSLRSDAPDNGTRTARTLVGMSSSRWE